MENPRNLIAESPHSGVDYRPVGVEFVARVMLQKLSNEIRECYRHAAEARQNAQATTHLPTKAEYQDVERRWLSLARSYEFSEQLARFTNEVKRNIRKR